MNLGKKISRNLKCFVFFTFVEGVQREKIIVHGQVNNIEFYAYGDTPFIDVEKYK